MKRTSGSKSFRKKVRTETSTSACSGSRPGSENRPSGLAHKSAKVGKIEQFRENLADQVREAYIFERTCYEEMMRANKRAVKRYKPNSRADGGKNYDGEEFYPEGSVFASVWGKLVTMLYGQKIDPVDYIRKVFSGLIILTDYVPSPTALLTERCMQIYRRAAETAKADIAVAFRSQHSTLQAQIAHIRLNSNDSTEEAIEETLYDEQLAMSSLFRYCVAAGMPDSRFEKVAEVFRVGAAVQYVRNSELYDEIWGDFIPEELKESAERIYHKVNEYLGEGTIIHEE